MDHKYELLENGVLYKYLKTKNALGEYTKKEMQGITSGPHKTVVLNYEKYRVVDLVLKHFYNEDLPKDYEVEYKDGNKLNCALENIIVSSPKDYVIGDSMTLGSDNLIYLGKRKWVSDKGYIYDHIKKNITYGYKIPTGYKEVVLEKKHHRIHRLVAKAFISNPQNLGTVNHINENKEDNRVENLEWASLSDNSKEYQNLREHRKLKMMDKRISELIDLNKKIKNDKKIVEKKYKELEAQTEKEKSKLLTEINKMKKLLGNYSKIRDYKIKVDFQNKKSGGDQSLVSKPVYINGIKHDSIKGATRYIVDQMALQGEVKSFNTILKEIRKYIRGERNSWKMYDKFLIE